MSNLLVEVAILKNTFLKDVILVNIFVFIVALGFQKKSINFGRMANYKVLIGRRIPPCSRQERKKNLTMIKYSIIAILFILLYILFPKNKKQRNKFYGEVSSKNLSKDERMGNNTQLDYTCPKEINTKPLSDSERQYLWHLANTIELKQINLNNHFGIKLKPKERILFKAKDVGADFIKSGYKVSKTDELHYGYLYLTNKRFIFVGNKRVAFDFPNTHFEYNSDTCCLEDFYNNENIYFYFPNQKDLAECFIIKWAVVNGNPSEDYEIADILGIELPDKK